MGIKQLPNTILTLTKPPKTVKTTISVLPSSNHCISLLKSCSNLNQFHPIHAHILTTNIIHDPSIHIHILNFFVSIDDLEYASIVLRDTRDSKSLMWNTLLENQVKNGDPSDVSLIYDYYYYMVSEGVVLNISSFHFLIHACSRLSDFRCVSEVHGRMLKYGLGYHKSLRNNLMGMYSKNGKLKEVRQLFDDFNERDCISWNTMISCYVRIGLMEKALILFSEMLIDEVRPDEITMISLISACTKLRDIKMGEKLHFYIGENKLKINGSLLNCLVDMYVKCGHMEKAHELVDRCSFDIDVVLWTSLIGGYVKLGKIEEARDLFDKMADRNLISWTSMISGYVQCGYYLESLKLLRHMMSDNVMPDEVAIITALSACVHVRDFGMGRSFHNLIVKQGMVVDGFLGNALIDLYAKCGELVLARAVFEQLPWKSVVSWNSMLDGFCKSGDIEKSKTFFDEIPDKDLVSWNTMINFYVRFNQFGELFKLFNMMQTSGTKPDKVTLVGLLNACSCVGSLSNGTWIHVYIKKHNIELDNMLGSALIDMYGKCGNVEKAYEIFSEINEKNVFLCTAMIAAYGMEGKCQKAIDIYLEMEKTKIKPDFVTFIALLSACSHGGLVHEGYMFFNKMITFYKIIPRIQHYGCMVDLLARVGHLEKAMKFIESMPIEPDGFIWSSLMRGCVTYHNVELAEQAFENLVKIDPENDAVYALLLNLYAKAGKWDDLSLVRRKMNEIEIRKKPGCSLIEHDGFIKEFAAGDFSDTKSAEIYSMLDEIKVRLKKDEIQESSVAYHSERLAVAYGLVSNPVKTPIRVTNNLRVCDDCHTFMKLISKVYDREIVVRDNYRFHRFIDGSCSCKDYW